MPTHEYWQFAFVKDVPTTVKVLPELGANAPLRVEMSNLPNGTAPDEDAPNTTVSGEHLRVYWSMPSNPAGYTLTGGVKILKSSKEFPRDPSDTTLTSVFEDNNYSLATRDTEVLHLDAEVGSYRRVWYYTAFYELQDANSDTFWAFSPVNGHDRGFTLTSVDSAFGEQLYNYFPRRIRQLDFADSDQPLYNLCQIFGRAFDEIKERLSRFNDTKYDPNQVDAALIPYIDQMLGWPTNFELTEGARRKETANILDIWKAKGTYSALELALQEVTGWEINFYEGYNFVLTTATADDFLDPNTVPVGWDISTDGDWANLVSTRAFNGTPDLSGTYTFSPGSYNNTFRTIFDNSGWQNRYGLLVELASAVTADALNSQLAREKVTRLMPYLSLHYAKWLLRVVENYSEVVTLNANDTNTDTVGQP